MTAHLGPGLVRRIDELAPAAREQALAHTARCAECRALLSNAAPERLFSLLVLDRIAPDALDRLSDSVARAVAAEPSPAPGLRVLRAGSLAASLVLGGLLGTYLLTAPVGVPEPAPASRADVASQLVAPTGLELVTPAEAEVVRVQIGDTELMMVFDKALEL